MRHNVYGKHLGRDKNQRTALFRGLVRSLLLSGTIQTTETKVKAIKGLVDKLISASQAGTSGQTRVIESFLPQKEIREKLTLVSKTFKTRKSGFTTTTRIGPRSGDGAMIVQMSIIKESMKAEKVEKETKVEEVVEKPEPKAVKRGKK